MTSKIKLLLATNNQAKLREYLPLLEGIPFQLTTLAEEGISLTVSETGTTLEENAVHKAITYQAQTGFLALADDSGLEVAALGGEPGPLSARYGGATSDKERIDLLLSKLEGISWKQRSARFRCVIAIALSPTKIERCQGECEGLIALKPKGSHGFGYDPVFYLPGLGKTMAELSLKEKNQVSHRGKAARKARQILEQWYERLI